jgi:hypothetical protein
MFKKFLLVGMGLVFILVIGMALTACGRSGSNLNGTWYMNPHSDNRESNSITFSGKNFIAKGTIAGVIRGTSSNSDVSGTFSLTEDRIEFVSSGGTITVRPFSRTENTIDIGIFSFSRRI